MRTLHIMAVGLRGIPDVQGGIETHVAELYPRLARLGARVTVLGRSHFRPPGGPTRWKNVRICWLWSPRRQGIEAAVHTILGVLYAGVRRPDILHVHAIGPAIALPLARILGLRVVFTHHGRDHQREKWGATARAILKLGERWGMGLSAARIAISAALRDELQGAFQREVEFIPNGMAAIDPVRERDLLAKLDLAPGRFIVQVSRLVPEKRQLDLIAAFRGAALPEWKLVLVGGGAASEPYVAAVYEAAATDPRIVCTGALPSQAVYQLLSYAGIFVLPSSHEGLPIALLEAIRLSVVALASDIPGNREIGMAAEAYFPVGDTAALAESLRAVATSADLRERMIAEYAAICSRYDWDRIAADTLALVLRLAPGTRVTTDR